MSTLPFNALVGLETAQQALLLLAVEPRLRGLVLAAPAGTGKSSLARGYAAIVGYARQSEPFVELPLGCDDEALLGGLDLEQTLRQGRRVARPGLLARAHGGVLYVDALNLLGDSSANLLMLALEDRQIRIERDGLSLCMPSSLSLIGSYDPAEGLPRKHLLDRVGLLVLLPRSTTALQRAEIVRRNLNTSHYQAEWQEESEFLQATVAAARTLLPEVLISDTQIGQLIALADAYGVEGHRAEGFAVAAARAAAALALRDTVEQADLELAAQLVIMSRATRLPQPATQLPSDQPTQPPAQPQADEQDQNTDTASINADSLPPEEQVLSALCTELPPDLADLPFRALRRGRTGSRGSTNGTRGRHIRSLVGNPRRQRIDIVATLRTAAPWQGLRQSEAHNQSHAVVLRADDLRVKQFRSKASALFLFAVDASGSMALHRMRQAKGAVHTLLQRAYVQRDRVALLAFRGRSAEVLLPASQSVELARRALDLLPTGGGTPLAAALLQALDMARQARSRGILQTVLVLLTDGRANVGLRAERDGIQAELQALGASIAESGIRTIVVDTQRNYLSRGEARNLASWLRGDYIYLPNAKGEQIAEAAMDAR